MAEGEGTNDMPDNEGPETAPKEAQEPRLRWRKRDPQAGASGKASAEQVDGAGGAATSVLAALSDEQTAAVEALVAERVAAAEQAGAEETTNLLKRERADFANYKRRSEQEREAQVKFANRLLIEQLLPIIDNFDRALATVPEDVAPLPWMEGLRLVDRQLRATLEKQGLRPIDTVGARFDPTVHEAIISEESADHKDDEIIAELQRGYMLHDQVVRPTLVKVAKNVAHAQQSHEER